jgi:hypothetical protein
MNWQNIKVSSDNTHFLCEGKQIFNKHFIEVLKFHSPGFAPVADNTGAYHIDTKGDAFYSERYTRAFGYYCNRAAVVLNEKWFHINELGMKAYGNSFLWVGNYQEDLCVVRNKNNKYIHLDLNGDKIYNHSYIYCGDFKDGYASVKSMDGLYRHIDTNGKFLNNKAFLDLGVFHKNFATARDNKGWFHINKGGNPIYRDRYIAVEPFYNGFALVTQFDMTKIIIDEQGKEIMTI